jgi:hypothetical protein
LADAFSPAPVVARDPRRRRGDRRGGPPGPRREPDRGRQRPSPLSPALSTTNIVRLIVILCGLGALVFLAIRALAPRRARLVWRTVAYAAMFVSFAPDLRMLGGAFANLPDLPFFPGFGGSGPRGGGFARNNSTNSTGFARASVGGAPFPSAGKTVAFLVVMHAVAAIVLTEALARGALRPDEGASEGR